MPIPSARSASSTPHCGAHGTAKVVAGSPAPPAITAAAAGSSAAAAAR